MKRIREKYIYVCILGSASTGYGGYIIKTTSLVNAARREMSRRVVVAPICGVVVAGNRSQDFLWLVAAELETVECSTVLNIDVSARAHAAKTDKTYRRLWCVNEI